MFHVNVDVVCLQSVQTERYSVGLVACSGTFCVRVVLGLRGFHKLRRICCVGSLGHAYNEMCGREIRRACDVWSFFCGVCTCPCVRVCVCDVFR